MIVCTEYLYIATFGANVRFCRRPGVVSARCRAVGRLLQDAELVAVRVGEDVPAPSMFGHGVTGEQGRAEAEDPLDLPFRAGGAQVQVQPVLLALVVASALQQHLDAWPSAGIRLR